MPQTNIPFVDRQRILISLIFSVLDRQPELSDGEAASFWSVVSRIYQDETPDWSTGERTAAIRHVKSINPELYNSIKPWITYVEEED